MTDQRDEPDNRPPGTDETPPAEVANGDTSGVETPAATDPPVGEVTTDAADPPPAGAPAEAPAETAAAAPAEAADEPPAATPAEAAAEAAERAEEATPPPDVAAHPAEDVPPGSDAAPTVPGEQIEWQPVVTGEQIEWQPVMSSEAQAWTEDTSAYPDYYYEGQYETAAEDQWDPAAAPVTGDRPPYPAAPVGPPAMPPGGEAPPRPDDAVAAAAKTKRQVVILSVLTAVVVLIGVLGFVLSRGATEKGEDAAPTASTTVPIVTLPQADLVSFRDEQTGFALKYPKTWQQLGAPLSDIRLTLDAGGNDGLRVRIFPIQTPATTQNIANLKAVTDTIVFGDTKSGRKPIQEQLVTLNGHLTYYYIYTFPDPVSGQEGVHVTYFVFEGHRMFQLVFQTVPADEFRQHAGIYDQIAESFTVEPERTTTAPPTTAAAPTTVP